MSQQWLEPHYDALSLFAAWAVAVYALYLQSLVVRRVRVHDRDSGFAWVLGGAIGVGTGIWAEGLLGLIALQLPMQLGYVQAILLASWLPAMVMSAGTIWMHCYRQLSVSMRVMGGLLVTSALCLLTFINASAIVLQPKVEWDGRFVVGAVILMLGTCVMGSICIRWALKGRLNHLRTLGVAVVVATLFRGGQMLLRNSNTTGFADIQFNLGLPTDVPIAGDWDGLP